MQYGRSTVLGFPPGGSFCSFLQATASVRVEAPCAMQQLPTLTMGWHMEVGIGWFNPRQKVCC